MAQLLSQYRVAQSQCKRARAVFYAPLPYLVQQGKKGTASVGGVDAGSRDLSLYAGMLHLERQIENMKRGPIQDEDAANEDEHESFQSFSLERLENNNQAIMQAIAQMPSPRKKSLGRSDSQLEMIPQPESRPYVAPGLTIKTL
eukprot:gene4427-5436_t